MKKAYGYARIKDIITKGEIMITENDVKHFATLSKLQVDEKVMLKYLREMEEKLLISEDFCTYETVEPYTHLREDKVSLSMAQEEILKNSKVSENGFFKLGK